MKTLLTTIALVIAASTASADLTKIGKVYQEGKPVGSIYDVATAAGMDHDTAITAIELHIKKAAIQRKKDRDQEVRQARKAAMVVVPVVEEVVEIKKQLEDESIFFAIFDALLDEDYDTARKLNDSNWYVDIVQVSVIIDTAEEAHNNNDETFNLFSFF